MMKLLEYFIAALMERGLTEDTIFKALDMAVVKYYDERWSLNPAANLLKRVLMENRDTRAMPRGIEPEASAKYAARKGK